MNRRGLLKGMGAATAAALWPSWLNEAFAGTPCGLLRGSATLAAALQRAHGGLQPLLVLVIPRDDGEKWERGRHLGEWLNFGADRDLAPLACAEVVCAEMAAVRQLFPSAPADTEPAALVASVDRAPARLGVALELFGPHVEPARGHLDRSALESLSEEEQRQAWAELRQRMFEAEDAAIQPCIDHTGAAIRQAVFGDPSALRSRASARWDRLNAEDREVARKILGGGDGSPRDVVAVAPVLASAAQERGGAEEERLTKVLAEAARVQYCTLRIPGSKWARSAGCGETVEGEEGEVGYACGMGHVPRKSQRFLYFFTRQTSGQ
ncbi:MAG TPA: hypothetical protein VND93_26370 [Myxococcales bacterium]|nr:hypothetical protein [Myxococcales bacterium]